MPSIVNGQEGRSHINSEPSLKPLVFIIGPLYTGVEVPSICMRRAIQFSVLIRKEGAIPYLPHLHHFINMLDPQKETFWLEFGHDIIRRCDAVFVFDRASKGSRSDIDFARGLGMPVFEGVEDLYPFRVWVEEWRKAKCS